MVRFGSENYTFIRFFHWIFSVSVILLLFSGMQISQPRVEALWPLDRTRNLHLIFASIFVFSLVGRMYYSIFHRSYRNFIVEGRDLRAVIPFLKYFLFLSPQPRFLLPRYDIVQKILILSWFLAAGIQITTGTILLFPEELRTFTSSIGNLQTCRSVHYYISLWFLFSVPLHIYLNITEEPLLVQSLLLGIGWRRDDQGGEKYRDLLFRKVEMLSASLVRRLKK